MTRRGQGRAEWEKRVGGQGERRSIGFKSLLTQKSLPVMTEEEPKDEHKDTRVAETV